MNECPVCRAPLFGRPDSCDQCLSPLSSQSQMPTGWALIFTLFFPGLGHLWRNHLLPGIVAAFFSMFILTCAIPLFRTVTIPVVLVFLVAGWLLWIGFWGWDIQHRRRKRVRFSSLTGTMIALLLLINLSLFINIILLSFGWAY